MSFETSTAWSRPASRKQRRVSEKWVDLQPRDRTQQKALGPGKKTHFWSFVNQILELFFVRIGLPRVCEIQSDFCDNYHIAKAHTRRRTTIPMTAWWFAFRVVFACGECHGWADHRKRDASENIIEAVIVNRFRALGLTERRVRSLLLECAGEVHAKNPGKDGAPGKFDEFVVIL